jgi:hypothetical protein
MVGSVGPAGCPTTVCPTEEPVAPTGTAAPIICRDPAEPPCDALSEQFRPFWSSKATCPMFLQMRKIASCTTALPQNSFAAYGKKVISMPELAHSI